MPRAAPHHTLSDRLSRLHFRPLLFSELDLLYGQVRLRRLELHRHLQLSHEVRPHDHRYAQILLYLSGRGEMNLSGHTTSIGPGSLVAAPAGLAHSFRRTSPRPPLCLTAEGTLPGLLPIFARAPASALHRLRELLHRLATLRESADLPHRTESAGLCLQILGLLLASLTSPHALPCQRAGNALAPRLARALATSEGARLSVAEIARKLGYDKDYFTRRIKVETGQTVRQLRDAARHRLAAEALAKGRPIDETSATVGFADPAHFNRWFRRHTGEPPAAFRRRVRAN